MKKELVYVAATRVRERVTAVTSDKELLRESVGRAGYGQSASGLVRKISMEKSRRPGQGTQRGMSQAREMAWRAVRREREEVTKDPVRQQEVRREGPVHEYNRKRGREDGIGR